MICSCTPGAEARLVGADLEIVAGKEINIDEETVRKVEHGIEDLDLFLGPDLEMDIEVTLVVIIM